MKSILKAIMIAVALMGINTVYAQHAETNLPKWAIGPFIRPEGVNPLISPDTAATFFDPMSKQQWHWEASDTFNPAATVMNGKICVLYRAEDNLAKGIGSRTSRVGFAVSAKGVTVKRESSPVLFPADD